VDAAVLEPNLMPEHFFVGTLCRQVHPRTA